jgi:hypothetical protein
MYIQYKPVVVSCLPFVLTGGCDREFATRQALHGGASYHPNTCHVPPNPTVTCWSMWPAAAGETIPWHLGISLMLGRIIVHHWNQPWVTGICNLV